MTTSVSACTTALCLARSDQRGVTVTLRNTARIRSSSGASCAAIACTNSAAHRRVNAAQGRPSAANKKYSKHVIRSLVAHEAPSLLRECNVIAHTRTAAFGRPPARTRDCYWRLLLSTRRRSSALETPMVMD